MITVLYTLLGILGVLVYIIGGVIWFFIDINDSPLWLLILTTILWPLIVVPVLALIGILYLVGFILIFLYNLFKAITGR